MSAPGSKNDLYFIGLVPDAKVEQEIQSFKMELLNKYQCKQALKSPAHITLIPPFAKPDHQAREVIEYFEAFRPPVQIFEVEIKGFGTFGTRTFFAQPESHSLLYKLHSVISEYLEDFFVVEKRSNYNFSPHITIANRDIKEEDLEEIVKEFSKKNYYAIAKFKYIFLFKFDGKKWLVMSKVSLLDQ